MASTAAAPQRAPAHYGNLQHTALSAFWFGSDFLWIPLTTVLIQAQVDEVVPKDVRNTAIGVALGLGGVLAMTVPPLVGAWSDRLNTRFGRRRPIMVAGTLLTIPGLLILMAANNYPEIIVGYAIIQFFFNAAGAAYAGIIPDVVPAQQIGKASGFLATMTQLGIGGGLGVTGLIGHSRSIYLVLGAVAALSLIPTVWAARTEGLVRIERPPRRPFGESIREFLRPLHEGDFAWVVFMRLMVSSGITVVLYFLVNFFGDVVLGPHQDAAKFTTNWLLVVVLTALPFGFFGGQISDRIHRRKIYIYLAEAAQAFVAIVFISFYPTSTSFVYARGDAHDAELRHQPQHDQVGVARDQKRLERVVAGADESPARGHQPKDGPVALPDGPSDEDQHREQEQHQVRAPRVAGHHRGDRHDGGRFEGPAGGCSRGRAHDGECDDESRQRNHRGDDPGRERRAARVAEECVGREQASDGTAGRVVLEETRARPDGGHHLEQVLEQVLRRRHQPQAKAGDKSGCQHRPTPRPQHQQPDGRLYQFQRDRDPKGRTAPPATRNPGQQPHARKRQQDEVDLSLDDVRDRGFEGDRHQHQERAQLPILNLHGPQNAEQKHDERCVEQDDGRSPEHPTVNPDHRLEKPGQRQRGDVLRAGGLEAAHRLAQVVWIVPGGQTPSGSHVALLEVAKVGSEGEGLDEGLPDVEEQDRYSAPKQKQATETPVGQRR